MAKLYITEFRNAQQLPGLLNSIPDVMGVIDQTPVTIGASSTQSSAFNAGTSVVRLHADAICSVAFGTDPTATAANMRMAANESLLIAVRPGVSFKVAVITNS